MATTVSTPQKQTTAAKPVSDTKNTRKNEEQPAASEQTAALNDLNFDNNATESEHEAISRMAYGYWLERSGRVDGSAEDDWFRAEHAIRGKTSA